MGPLISLSAFLLLAGSMVSSLDPTGKNVCQDGRDPPTWSCCAGWRQQGADCSAPVCEGELSCSKEETCVYPGVCRCPPGYFGAHCKTRCPPEFWSPDCREVCVCYPHGRCHPVTGECSCNPNRWGRHCQYACKCAGHGRCQPQHGNCTCEPGWWTPTCAKPCHCAGGGAAVGAACDQLTGRCQCSRGHWGQRCSQSCSCHVSPCDQRSGLCQCLAGWWGPSCDRRCDCERARGRCDPVDGRCVCQPGFQGRRCERPCVPGTYGSGCTRSCGRCRDAAPCSTVDGVCEACERGWNGSRCNLLCPSGYYGDACRDACPRCRNNRPCDPQTGTCRECDPGWTGPRCEQICPVGKFGDNCSFLCGPCFHGNCNHVTGSCVCEPGFQGESCNSSCQEFRYGANCSSSCSCADCHPASGACPSTVRGAVLAGVLVPVLLVLLAVLCCCLGCGDAAEDKDRSPAVDGGVSARLKYRMYSVLANVGAAFPCSAAWSSGLPRVTVSHHDPEMTFNHSFIEPPSTGWTAEFSSFDSDEEEGEALYCLPPREDILAVAGGEFQELSSKCKMFLEPSGFSGEDVSSSFSIPRTSSIAKTKRPSVSFAEGTRFSPKERRGSMQETVASCGRGRAKPPRGSEDGLDGQQTDKQDGRGPEEEEEPEEQGEEPRPKRDTSKASVLTGPQGAASPSEVTTVYVTVGRAPPAAEGPVQAVLRRLGSLQRTREAEPSRSRARGAEKPPRRKLGTQGGASGAEGAVCKPIRRKHANAPGQAPPPAGRATSYGVAGSEVGGAQTEGPAGLSRVNEDAATSEPSYENVLITSS